jgi:phosphatidylglycerol---prolipoprotein diacylglyceryl transferase
MLVHPNFDPVAIRLGPLAVHWYGLMYLLGFWGAWWLGTLRTRLPHVNWPRERVGDLLFYVVLGVILGGRIGYTFFYNFDGFVQDPSVLFRIWEGGMSFHGGLIGVLVAMGIFGWRQHLGFWEVADFCAVIVPFGLLTGRIGNFINGELWGAPTNMPWGMVFPRAGPETRHPTMLYEAGLEGLAMLAILWWYSSTPRPRTSISALFLLLYAGFRTFVETMRLPDAHIGYLFGTTWLTMGMMLCLPMWLAGGVLWWWTHGHHPAAAPTGPKVVKP